MSYWLLKTEPAEFSWDDQIARRAEGERWSGVRNHAAKNNLLKMKKGERAFFYHTGGETRIVGIAEVIRDAYPDPTDETGKFVALDVKAVKALPRPVTLTAIKAEPRLRDMALVKFTRLSVQPVTDREWAIVCAMGGLKGE